MNTLAINQSWKDWIPGYFLFKRDPTAMELAQHRKKIAEKNLRDALLSVIEARAEIEKQSRIIQHLEENP